MNGLMMDIPLTITSIVRHAERVHGHKEIVSITRDNPRHRYTYRDCFARARQLANAMHAWDLKQGDRVATLAWNDYRHTVKEQRNVAKNIVEHIWFLEVV